MEKLDEELEAERNAKKERHYHSLEQNQGASISSTSACTTN